MKVKIYFTCYLISSLEPLNVRQYLWVVVHMILPFLLETFNLVAEFLVLSILVVLKLLTLVMLKIILFIFMAPKSLSNLFVLVVAARWLLVQILCP
jgi:hypothetical protein